MDRKFFLKGIGASIVAGTALSGCTSNKEEAAETVLQSGMVIHSVYFWLKEGITEEEEKDFLNFFEALKNVPGVSSYYVGKPAPTTPRPVVDNSFSYHWLTFHDSMEDIDIYEKHPDHLKAVEQYSKYWVKVDVRDSIL